MAKNYGILKEHLYILNDWKTIKNKNFIRLHNPFNSTDYLDEFRYFLFCFCLHNLKSKNFRKLKK